MLMRVLKQLSYKFHLCIHFFSISLFGSFFCRCNLAQFKLFIVAFPIRTRIKNKTFIKTIFHRAISEAFEIVFYCVIILKNNNNNRNKRNWQRAETDERDIGTARRVGNLERQAEGDACTKVRAI